MKIWSAAACRRFTQARLDGPGVGNRHRFRQMSQNIFNEKYLMKDTIKPLLRIMVLCVYILSIFALVLAGVILLKMHLVTTDGNLDAYEKDNICISLMISRKSYLFDIERIIVFNKITIDVVMKNGEKLMMEKNGNSWKIIPIVSRHTDIFPKNWKGAGKSGAGK